MSFSAEIADFVKGFQAGSAVGGDIMDRKFKKEQAELDRAFKEKDFEFAREKFADMRSYRDRRAAVSDERYEDDKTYRRGRDAVSDERYEDDKTYRRGRDAVSDERYGAADRRAEAASRRADEQLKLRREALELNSLNTLGTDPGATKAGSYADDYPIEEVVETEIDIPEVDQKFKRGGLVVKANTGGAIPEEPPVEAPVVGEGKTDLLTEQVKPILKEVFDDEAANVGQKPEAIATKPKKGQSRISVISGEGAATPDEIKAMDKVIDPEGRMEPYRKGAQRLVTAYNFFVEKGETEKARNVAKRIVAFHNQAARVQGQLAQAAIERGDLRAASKLVTDAYNENIMDGKTIEAQPTPRGTVAYKTDNEAFAQQQGEIGAQQLWALASGAADGSAFLDAMTDLAATAKSKGSYSADVKAAAQARKSYEELKRKFDSNSDILEEEELKPLRAQLSDAYSAYEAALKKAETAAEKTKRPRKVFEEDLARTYRNTSVPPPAEQALPEAPAEESGGAFSNYLGLVEPFTPTGIGRRIGNAVGGYLMGGEEAPVQQALPTAPVPAQPTAPAPVTIRSKEEFDALPSGATFVAPDGSVRRKP